MEYDHTEMIFGRSHRELKQHEWDRYFMGLCKHVATRSKDRSTKLGAVIVDNEHATVSTGYNSFPRGIDDYVEARYERPEKYFWFEHAERNAIFGAARNGTSLRGCKIYCAWMPCADCARAIIQVGIVEVILDGELYEARANDPVWSESFKRSIQMFDEARVGYRIFKEK
jgi:dCMP deaminase